MKNRKIILAIMMAALLAGCGDDGGNGDSGNTGILEENRENSDKKEDTSEAAAEETSEAESGQASETVENTAGLNTEPAEETVEETGTDEIIDDHPMPDFDYEEYDYGYEGVNVSISWDEEGVTFFEDSGTFDLGDDPMCAPRLVIEGADVERSTSVYGTQHIEDIIISDRNAHVHIMIEPCAPTNNCPLDTVTVLVTDSEKGIIGAYTAEDMRRRGGTGIWYLDVYEQ